jgi:uncharacterized protein
MQDAQVFFIIAYLLMLVGFIGSVLPIVPGPILIWLGTFVWAWTDKFERVGWPTLIVLAVLTLLAWVANLGLAQFTSRRAGASWKAIGAAIICGIAGGILLAGTIPVLGGTIGGLLGALAGLVIIEYLDKHNMQLAVHAGVGYLSGCLMSHFVDIVASLLMIGIFAWQAFL